MTPRNLSGSKQAPISPGKRHTSRRLTAKTAGIAFLSAIVASGVTAPAASATETDAQNSGSYTSSQLVPGVPGSTEMSSQAGSSTLNPDDPFYANPATIPSKSGEVIRTQADPHLLNALALPGPGYAQKILYSTKDQFGKPTTASGFVIEPIAKWQGKGPVPTIVFAPGTRGQADICAPSRTAGLIGAVDVGTGAVNLNYELPTLYAASAMGIRVVATDLIGLGTPGVHTYMNRVEQANATLDAARAGMKVLGAAPSDPVGFYGYSQGGGAAASAAEAAGSYAPDLNVKGTYAGAAPADLMKVIPAIDRGSIAGVLGYALNGYLYRRPDLEPLVDKYLNQKGKDFLAQTKVGCTGDTIAKWAFTDSRSLTKSGESFMELLEELPELKALVKEQEIGLLPLNAPMLAGGSVHDDAIPYDQVKTMATNYCKQGGTVELLTDETPQIWPKSSLNHVVPMFTEMPTALGYMNDRFNDVPAPNNCATFAKS